MSAESFGARVDALMKKHCWLVDYLPESTGKRVSGQYFKVEAYILNHFDELGFRARISNVLLKLMCCRRVQTDWGGWSEDPSPEKVMEAVREIMVNHSGTLNLLLPEDDALVVFEWDTLSVRVYHPDGKLRRLMEDIAASEGMSWHREDK